MSPQQHESKWIMIAPTAMVLRNASINAKYPGGMPAFTDEHRPTSNDDISVLGRDLEEIYSSLRFKGLKPGGDFTVLDEVASELPPWLNCRQTTDGLYVSYAEKLNEDDFVIEALRIIGIDPLSLGHESYRIVREELLRMQAEMGNDKTLAQIKKTAAHHKAQIEYLVSLAD